ncbi:related to TAE1 - AdoMet-dependent proline methyltransferase [Ustilago trichophora]|uniref:Alpha N-terminal protein methyltransferase 1 n=1 Tax=Ustilago trichophora TaxID=86804 RepID=A0A5C3DU69_9BASI|nr:related to TAE1 - AdoMet-dependent proline methyltransferase [Ustilago trichophora]
MSAIRIVHPTPDVKRGVQYWEGVEASVDGVLGGFGHVSRVESLGSRSFLMGVLPHLSFCAPASSNVSAFQWKNDRIAERGGKGKARTRALDCGAGVGRVTQHSLIPIFDEVHMVEPVAKFLLEAKKQSASWPQIQTPPSSSPFQARKAVHFHCSTLQDIEPSRPYSTAQPVDGGSIPPTVSIDDDASTTTSTSVAESDTAPTESEGVAGSQTEPVTYDLVWAQWCLQHLSDKDLISFLQRSKAALKPGGVIGVKENVCTEEADGTERVWYDDEDHSITRSTKAYERVFNEAGLDIVKCEIQFGMPAELFVVKM